MQPIYVNFIRELLMNTIPITLKLRCPACGRSDQFIYSDNIQAQTPDDAAIGCLCGVTNRFDVLQNDAVIHEGECLARETLRRTLGNLLK